MTEALNASSPRTLVVERTMAQPLDKIWRALTQSALMEDWLMKNDFEPVVGRKFTLRAPPMPQWNGIVDCEVLEITPKTKLAYRWDVGADHPEGLRTVVTWTLTPVEGGVRVRMEQAGFEKEANYQGANYGWQKFFGGLEKVVAELI